MAKDVYEKLAEVQESIGHVLKDGKNSYQGNKYATLDNILAKIKAELSKKRLLLTQTLQSVIDENSKCFSVVTMLIDLDRTEQQKKDKDGVIASALSIPFDDFLPVSEKGNKLQAIGSAATYLRRYSLAALFSLSFDEDDDGVGAGGHYEKSSPRAPKHPSRQNVEKTLDAKVFTKIIEKIKNKEFTEEHKIKLSKYTLSSGQQVMLEDALEKYFDPT